MRSILLHIDSDPGFEARLQASLDLVRAMDGHLTCLQTISYDFAVPGDIYGSMVAEMLPVVRENANKLRDKITARLESEDVRWDWRQEQGPSRDSLLGWASLADVVLLGVHDPLGSARAPAPLLGDLVVNGGTPVLVMPDTAKSFDVAGVAVVGWNGSIEAAHALRAATPLLARASSVVVACVAEERDNQEFDLPPLDGAEYLSRHGIECEIVELPLEAESVAEALADAAAARRAALLVIGGYGRPRVVETVFGGVTRKLLSAPPLPILTAH